MALVLALMAGSVLARMVVLVMRLNPTLVVSALMIRKINVLRHFTVAGTEVVDTEGADTEVAGTEGAGTVVTAAGLDQVAMEGPSQVPGVVGVAAEQVAIGAGTAGAIPGDGMDPYDLPLNAIPMLTVVKKNFVDAMDIAHAYPMYSRLAERGRL